MEDALPWASLNFSGRYFDIATSSLAFNQLSVHPDSSPTLVALLGRTEKSHLLRQLLLQHVDYPALPHNQLFLWSESVSLAGDSPFLFLDSEVHHHALRQHLTLTQAPRPSMMDQPAIKVETKSSEQGYQLLASHIIYPLCPIICVFYEDFRGNFGEDLNPWTMIARFLANHTSMPSMSSSNGIAPPHVLVVVQFPPPDLNVEAEESSLHERFHEARLENEFIEDTDGQHVLFAEIRVICMPAKNRSGRAAFLRAELVKVQESVLNAQREARMLFTWRHQKAIMEGMMRKLCWEPRKTFSLIHCCRPLGDTATEFEHHLYNMMRTMVAETWLWHLVAPHAASCILMASYPPGAHRFEPMQVFDKLYRQACCKAVCRYSQHPKVHEEFVARVIFELRRAFERVDRQGSALDVHLAHLEEVSPLMSSFKSNKSCLLCLMRAPEKPLSCGHAICEICVRLIGRRDVENRNEFVIPRCPLCNTVLHGQRGQRVRLMPSTAGPRLLSIDGEGAAGIAPLVLLRGIEMKLSPFGLPLGEYFDFACGVSAGGLAVLGVFLQGWTAADMTSKYKSFVTTVVRTSPNKPGTFSRLGNASRAFRDYDQYSPTVIAASFCQPRGSDRMFRPRLLSIKVAVSIGSTKLLTNYNGRHQPREGESRHRIVRPADPMREDGVVDAALQTVKAAGYLGVRTARLTPSQSKTKADSDQPSRLSFWEVRRIWPDISMPDINVSLDAVVMDQRSHGRLGNAGGPRPYFLKMCAVDLKRPTWSALHSAASSAFASAILRDQANDVTRHEVGQRTFRLRTLVHSRTRPGDTLTMDGLEQQAVQHAHLERARIASICDRLISSAFYFELEELPCLIDGSYRCGGSIYCRLGLEGNGRSHLYNQLVERRAWFQINDSPHACMVGKHWKGSAPYRCQVVFTVSRLEDTVSIKLGGWAEQLLPISGMPRSVEDIVRMQKLDAPFGRADHATSTTSGSRLLANKQSKLSRIEVRHDSVTLLTPLAEIFSKYQVRVRDEARVSTSSTFGGSLL